MNLADELSLETLATLEGFSPYHFARMFKDAHGQPPNQYIITHRVAGARHLPHNTRLSLSQVAMETGFANQSPLTRHFKRVFGVI